MPKAYVLTQYNLDDAEKMGQYVPGAIGSVVAHGGAVLVAAEGYDCREGSPSTHRTVILEFPSHEAAAGWYESPGYQAIAHLRHEATSEGSLVIVDGFAAPGG